MVVRYRVLACPIMILLSLWYGYAHAQNPSTPPAAPVNAAPVPPVATSQPVVPKIDTADLIKRANKIMGVNIDDTVKQWQANLEKIEESLRKPGLRYNELNGFRDDLLKLRAEAEGFWSKLEPQLSAAEDQAQKLPTAPAAGQPPESEQAAQYRTEINYQLGYLRGARLSLDRTHARINQSINTIQDIRRRNFTNNLFQPVPGIFAKQTWVSAPDFAKSAVTKVEDLAAKWWAGLHDRDNVLFLIGAAILIWLVLTVGAFFGGRRLKRWSGEADPPYWRRASAAAGVIVFRSLPSVISLLFLYNAVAAAEPMPNEVGWLFYVAARSIIIIVVVNALIAAVLSPGDQRWRLIAASNWGAFRVSTLMLALALTYGVATFAYVATRIVQSPFSLTVALSFSSNLLVALLVVLIVSTPLHQKLDASEPFSGFWPRLFRLVVWLTALAIVITSVSGYLAFSRFLAQQLIVTGSILAIVYILLLCAHAFTQAMADESSGIGSWLSNNGGLDQSRRERLAVPFSLVWKFAVLVGSVPLILLQWGYPWGDIMELYHQLFFEFHIGGTQVSLGAILASLVVFVLGYFAAKLFQQWLDKQVLMPAGLSHGLRDSIRTGVGYIGVFAAALFALSYAGFNLSNLAIVAGAFSVGIGFGLQSVVNNFVSGLIMLAERPVKVGDLVVVGGEEGYVRKISVRSTEIETFDRANVLIPNSFFISEKVKNWTLRNNTGRLTVQAAVGHGSDPRLVKSLLLQVAKSHPKVMSTPAPFVDFEDFGSDTLNFKLYAYIYDLTESINIRTDLRIAILDAFQSSGIAIPSRQTDITVRDIDWLRDAVKLYIAQAFDGKISDHSRRAAIVAPEPAE
jgi:potassium-dependent mechanosensitive channel